MTVKSVTSKKIVDTALELAEAKSWRLVHLSDIASMLHVPLKTIKQHFPEKQDLISAWFDRADDAMLDISTGEEFLKLPYRRRLQRLIMTWLEALSVHRRVTIQMASTATAVSRIRKTIFWINEAAHGDDSSLVGSIIKNTILTSIFLATFSFWLRDHSEDAIRTNRFLEKQLMQAETATDYFNYWVREPVSRLFDKLGLS